jgi:hypothetical protein
MAHLWIRDTTDWAALRLDGERLQLADLPLPADDPAAADVVLLGTGSRRREWHLMAAAGTGVTINGLPLIGGLRTLADRDEIRVRGLGTLYFSTERLAEVEPLPNASSELICPRCRQPIAADADAVRCPACDIWYHQSAEFPCWTYAPTCGGCGHPTPLDEGFAWSPEAL